jgi:hypothetical protein|nr:MAG TPA: hypothetical protein [Caudoviricetes sp.]
MSDKLNPLIVENTGELFHITADGSRKPLKDESRLLPENPANGDIPYFDADVVVGSNDETVKFLLQPVISNKELVDSAYGNPTKVVINNHGLTVDGNGAVVFTTSTYGTIAAGTLPADVLVHDKPWVIDLLMKLDEGQWSGSELVYLGSEGSVSFWFQWTDNYKFECNYDGNWTGTELGNLGEEHLVTLEYYQDTDSNWYVALYLDGTFRSKKQVSSSTDMRNHDLCIGRRSSGKSPCSGQFKAIRIRAGAPYKGQTFTPDEFPYREPQTVGEWGKLNKADIGARRVKILSRDPGTRLAVVQPLRLRNGVWETDPDAPEKTVKY